MPGGWVIDGNRGDNFTTWPARGGPKNLSHDLGFCAGDTRKFSHEKTSNGTGKFGHDQIPGGAGEGEGGKIVHEQFSGGANGASR